MHYAILAYHVEGAITAMTPEEDAALMVELRKIDRRLTEEGMLGPAARLDFTRSACTLRDGLVIDGPFAETKEQLLGLYDAVNIKLDKTGGLTAALELRDRARELGFGVMVGCMVGTSLAMAPALLVAQDADFVDLDGPLLLARDRETPLAYEGSQVAPPEPALWG